MLLWSPYFRRVNGHREIFSWPLARRAWHRHALAGRHTRAVGLAVSVLPGSLVRICPMIASCSLEEHELARAEGFGCLRVRVSGTRVRGTAEDSGPAAWTVAASMTISWVP
jgi:hypothetical protein